MLKSVKDGILIQVNDIKENIKDLEEKLEKNFFDKQTDFILEIKDKIYFPELWKVINRYGHNLCIMKYIVEKPVKKKTNIIRKKIRSGQSLKLTGDVLLLEDLNHGGELIATGNVYVIGKAMGFIHAGASGDRNAMVMALELNVSHLKIADVLAKNDGENNSDYPERAFLDGEGNLIVEEVILHNNISDLEPIKEEKTKNIFKRFFCLKNKKN